MFSPSAAVNDGAVPPRARFGIFSKVYGFVLLLAVLAIAGMAALIGYIQSTADGQLNPLAEWVVDEAYRAPSAERGAMLLRLHDQGGVRLSLYSIDGGLIASGGRVYAPLPDTARLRGARVLQIDEEASAAVAIERNGSLVGYGVVGFAHPAKLEVGPLALAALFAAAALIAWPVALSLLRPIRRLEHAVAHFGNGELEARVQQPGRDEIGLLAHSFNRMADRIQALLRSEKMLVAAISHELRTPLQRLRLALDLNTNLAPAIASDLEELDALLGDALVIARLDQPGAVTADGLLRKDAVPADELLAECVASFEANHPDRELRWIEGPPLPSVTLDPRFAHRAVLNLLDNADHYSPAGKPVTLEGSLRDGWLVIEVRDAGDGIPPDLQDKIFEPFFRADASRGTSGSGLGLAIVQKVAQAHGGKVEVASTTSGSSFRLYFPAGSLS